MNPTLKRSMETPFPSPAKPPTLHHVGFVVASISQVGSRFAESLGAQWNGDIIHDPLQEARVTFLRCAGPETPAVELVEPDGEKSQLQNFLRRGGGLHHVCFEVDSLNAQLEQSRAAGCLILRKPLPAAAFRRTPDSLGLHARKVVAGISGALLRVGATALVSGFRCQPSR